MSGAHNLRSRLEKLEQALLARSGAPEIVWRHRVHTAQRVQDLRVTECANADGRADLVLDYLATRQGDEWRLIGEARRRRAGRPEDKGNIITTAGMKIGEVVRDLGRGVIEMIVNFDEEEWDEHPDLIWGGAATS